MQQQENQSSNTVIKLQFHVEGFATCPYFQNSRDVAITLWKKHPDQFEDPVIVAHTRTEWDKHKLELAKVITSYQSK
jgi:hypothetical protein